MLINSFACVVEHYCCAKIYIWLECVGMFAAARISLRASDPFRVNRKYYISVAFHRAPLIWWAVVLHANIRVYIGIFTIHIDGIYLNNSPPYHPYSCNFVIYPQAAHKLLYNYTFMWLMVRYTYDILFMYYIDFDTSTASTHITHIRRVLNGNIVAHREWEKYILCTHV